VHVQLELMGEVYEVTFEVAEDADGLARRDASTRLSLHWGLHRESLDEWMCLPDLPPVRTCRYCSPRHRMPCNSINEGVRSQMRIDDDPGAISA
jgi:hypothetical protein